TKATVVMSTGRSDSAPSTMAVTSESLFSHNLKLWLLFLFLLLVLVTLAYLYYINPFGQADDKEILRAKNVYLGRRLRSEQEKSGNERKKSNRKRNSSSKRSVPTVDTYGSKDSG